MNDLTKKRASRAVFVAVILSWIVLAGIVMSELSTALNEEELASGFTVMCASLPLLTFWVATTTAIGVSCADRIRVQTVDADDTEPKRVTVDRPTRIVIAGVMLLFSIVYSGCVDPYMLGEDRFGVFLMALVPLVLQVVVMELVSFAKRYMGSAKGGAEVV